MNHSKYYERVLYYYTTFVNGKRLWDIDRVTEAVNKGWITEEEFDEITGENEEEIVTDTEDSE